ASLMLVNKLDLLPHVEFDLDRVIANAREANANIAALCLSARTGEGMRQWYDWLRREWTVAVEAAFA
ncbi:MAG TPA: hydrogenase accessory protein HypB, partial [Acetobacteraceae bacterium]